MGRRLCRPGAGLALGQAVGVAGMDPAAIAEAFRDPDDIHEPITSLVVLENTHAHSGGRPLPLEYVREVAAIAHDRGVPLHMDGARFANALVALGCAPAEMTWKAGVDILSFGGTKNGAMIGEAIVLQASAPKRLPSARRPTVNRPISRPSWPRCSPARRPGSACPTAAPCRSTTIPPRASSGTSRPKISFY